MKGKEERNMNMLIHDLKEKEFASIQPDDVVISACNLKQNCRGCWGCWVKTPGQCILPDGYERIGKNLAKADTVTIVSKCIYGTVSQDIKRVIDRSIGYAHPFFVTENKVMHHKRRYQKHFDLHLIFYGKLSEMEKETARKYALFLEGKYAATSLNLEFYDKEEEIAI